MERPLTEKLELFKSERENTISVISVIPLGGGEREKGKRKEKEKKILGLSITVVSVIVRIVRENVQGKNVSFFKLPAVSNFM